MCACVCMKTRAIRNEVSMPTFCGPVLKCCFNVNATLFPWDVISSERDLRLVD
ncbi:hypothetical protein PUN28_019404 [Cardiocondyla obscurior]|uniref:Uncharacterized protein n=1 Tax=Cardiocondyla obscurior TaxID=286306 RepID=A0AAW2EC51_9HYME